MTLGTYPDTGLKEARELHASARKVLAAGIDPNENRKNNKATKKLNAANSFEMVAREWWQSYMKKWHNMDIEYSAMPSLN